MNRFRTRITEWLDETTTRRHILPAYALIAIASFVGVGEIRDVNTQRTEDLQAYVVTSDYILCLSRIETRDALRSILLALTLRFPEAKSTEVILELIETDYPALDAGVTCEAILEGP